MKLIIFPSVAAMVVMLTLVLRQEINRRTLTIIVRDKTALVSGKEKAIAELKDVMAKTKPKLLSLTKQTEDMKTKQDTLEKEKKALQDNISTCNKEKGEAEKTQAEAADTLNKEKSAHDQAKETAQKTIQDLKQKNLDRDKAICAVVDTTNAEARKLCGLPDASP